MSVSIAIYFSLLFPFLFVLISAGAMETPLCHLVGTKSLRARFKHADETCRQTCLPINPTVWARCKHVPINMPPNMPTHGGSAPLKHAKNLGKLIPHRLPCASVWEPFPPNNQPSRSVRFSLPERRSRLYSSVWT